MLSLTTGEDLPATVEAIVDLVQSKPVMTQFYVTTADLIRYLIKILYTAIVNLATFPSMEYVIGAPKAIRTMLIGNNAKVLIHAELTNISSMEFVNASQD